MRKYPLYVFGLNQFAYNKLCQGEPGAQGRLGLPGPPGRFITGPKVKDSVLLSHQCKTAEIRLRDFFTFSQNMW